MSTDVKSIVFFGECMREHRANGTESYGGDTFNTAWYCQSLLKSHCHFNIHYATALGHKAASRDLLELIQSSRVKTDYIVRHPTRELGEYKVHLTDDGDRSFSFERDQSAVKSYFDLDEPLTEALLNADMDAFYLSGISLAILTKQHRLKLIEAMQVFKQKGGIIIFDNNYRTALWKNESPLQDYFSIMALADIAFLTDEDEYKIYGTKSVDDIIDLHAKDKLSHQLLVIRQGAKPCIINDNITKTKNSIPAQQLEKSQVIDTCAAGDSFAAGFLASYFTGQTLESAAQFAHIIASEVIQHHGALIEPNRIPKLFQ